MAILSSDGTKVLLGRQKRWPKDWYSTLAGFLEPGESIEEAVRREVWEESGVEVGRVVIHSSQPWPFPASLMIGAVGQALPGDKEKIYLGNDPELESAKWVRRSLSDDVTLSSLTRVPYSSRWKTSRRLSPRGLLILETRHQRDTRTEHSGFLLRLLLLTSL
jgi:NADH pyrophosphatase NudC (nudix superfamily)